MKILMVCLGNICRSPLAQGILEDKIKKYNLDWIVDSAGTSGWHDGEQPDNRAISTARNHGVFIDKQKSRKIEIKDLEEFDLICTMDSSNYNHVRQLSNNSLHQNKVELLLNLAYPGKNLQVPDPYFDGRFEEVYKILDDALEIFIKNKINMV
jgi:protein-tyrosine phosphatase